MSRVGKSRPGRPRNKRVLVSIIAILIVSGVLRIGASDIALAEIAGLPVKAAEPVQCVADPEIAALMSTLRSRTEDLDQREKRVAEREQTLALADVEIASKLTQLEEAETRLSLTISVADKAAEGDLARLTSVYESMKPRVAAQLFETMAPEFAAGFLARMRPDAAAAVLSGLRPDTAYTISVVMAGRNAEAPKE